MRINWISPDSTFDLRTVIYIIQSLNNNTSRSSETQAQLVYKRVGPPKTDSPLKINK